MFARSSRISIIASFLTPAMLLIGSAVAHAETTGDETDGVPTEPSVMINFPADGAVVGEAPLDLAVQVEVDIDGAWMSTTSLLVDGVEQETTCSDTVICNFMVPLEAGDHTLQASLYVDPSRYVSSIVTVTVTEESTTGASDTGALDTGSAVTQAHDSESPQPDATDGDDSSSPPADDKGGCSIGGSGGHSGVAMAFFLLAAGALGRRRRAA